jgi:hypothetical protein
VHMATKPASSNPAACPVRHFGKDHSAIADETLPEAQCQPLA